MSQLKARCIDQVLTFENTPVITSGDVNYDTIMFDFCSRWDGYTKTAIFYRSEDEVYYQLLDEANTCNIPNEVLTEKGDVYIGVFGTSGDTTLTSQVLKYKITKGAITENLKPSDPTPDIYSQILSRYAEIIEKLERQFQKLEDLQSQYTGAVGNADTLNGHKSDYFATAESVTNLTNGITPAGDSDKLGGRDADNYFLKSGGTINGNVTRHADANKEILDIIENGIRKVYQGIGSDGTYYLHDGTNDNSMIVSARDGKHTFNGTATGNVPTSGGVITGDLELASDNAVNKIYRMRNAKRNIGFIVRDDGAHYVYDDTNFKMIYMSDPNGTNTWYGTASGNLPLAGGIIGNGVNSPYPLVIRGDSTRSTIDYTDKDGITWGLFGFVGKDKPMFVTADRTKGYELHHDGNSAKVHIGTTAPSDTSSLWIDTN